MHSAIGSGAVPLVADAGDLGGMATLAAQHNLEAWIIRVAKNLWLDQLRRKKVRDVAVDPAMLGATSGDDAHVRLEEHEVYPYVERTVPEEALVAMKFKLGV